MRFCDGQVMMRLHGRMTATRECVVATMLLWYPQLKINLLFFFLLLFTIETEKCKHTRQQTARSIQLMVSAPRVSCHFVR